MWSCAHSTLQINLHKPKKSEEREYDELIAQTKHLIVDSRPTD
jgi:hypothetical protein